MTTAKNVPIDPLEQNRRALLDEIKEDALDKEWTPELNGLVETIDGVTDNG